MKRINPVAFSDFSAHFSGALALLHPVAEGRGPSGNEAGKNSDEVGPDLMAFNYVSHKVFLTVWHVGHSQSICHTAPISAALLAMAISMGIFVTVIRVFKLQC